MATMQFMSSLWFAHVMHKLPIKNNIEAVYMHTG